jgi:small-conductance mechanosensitive channel
MGLLERNYYGNSASEWMIAAGIAVGITLVLAMVRVVASRRLRPKTFPLGLLLVVVRHTRYIFLAFIGVGIGATYLTLPGKTLRILGIVITLLTLFQIAWWGHGVMRFWVRRVITQRAESDLGSVTAIRTFGTIGLVALWAVILLAVIATLGIDVTALVAGLGIGGIAIALAVQNIVGDLFASVSIIVDKPFVVGDFIQVENLLGSVQQIGLKTTRLNSLSGEQLIFGNGDLLKSRIHNYKRMMERRVVFTIRVEYGTPQELVEKVPGMIRDAITEQSPVRMDRAHFKEYGESALVYEAVYYVLSPDYNVYMDIQQAINYQLYGGFDSAGIKMALPTRTVMLQVSPDAAEALSAAHS